MSDRLALAHVIEDAGIERDKAENLASAIARFVEGSTATKADVDRVSHEVHASEVALRLELAQLEHRLTRNGIGGLVVAVGIILAALRFLGHG